MESHCSSNIGTVGLLIVTSGAKDTVALRLFGITNRDRWMYVGRHCNILSQVNIAVNVELRNVTRIAQTVEVWSPTWHTEATAGAFHFKGSILFSKPAIKSKCSFTLPYQPLCLLSFTVIQTSHQWLNPQLLLRFVSHCPPYLQWFSEPVPKGTISAPCFRCRLKINFKPLPTCLMW